MKTTSNLSYSLLFGLGITIVVVLVQNLDTVVKISFLGFSSIPIPLSLAMLVAFLGGSITAGLWNQLSIWLGNKPGKNDRKTSFANEEVEDNDEDLEDENEEDDDDIIEIEYLDR